MTSDCSHILWYESFYEYTFHTQLTFQVYLWVLHFYADNKVVNIPVMPLMRKTKHYTFLMIKHQSTRTQIYTFQEGLASQILIRAFIEYNQVCMQIISCINLQIIFFIITVVTIMNLWNVKIVTVIGIWMDNLYHDIKFILIAL